MNHSVTIDNFNSHRAVVIIHVYDESRFTVFRSCPIVIKAISFFIDDKNTNFNSMIKQRKKTAVY